MQILGGEKAERYTDRVKCSLEKRSHKEVIGGKQQDMIFMKTRYDFYEDMPL